MPSSAPGDLQTPSIFDLIDILGGTGCTYWVGGVSADAQDKSRRGEGERNRPAAAGLSTAMTDEAAGRGAACEVSGSGSASAAGESVN
jgi:hypothetical protein